MLRMHEIKSEMFAGLADVKNRDNADILRFGSEAVAHARTTIGRPYAWCVDNIEKVSATLQIRSIGHGLQPGDIVKLVGSSTSPTTNATYTISAVLDENTIVVPWAGAEVTGGTKQSAMLHVQRTIEFVGSGNLYTWIPQQILPMESIVEISERVSRTEWVLIPSDEWRVIPSENTVSPDRTMRLERTVGVWPQFVRFVRGQYQLPVRDRMKTLKVLCWAGAKVMPADLRTAVQSVLFDLYERQGTAKDEASFSYEGVSSSKAQTQERRQQILSPDRVFATYAVKTMRQQ